MPQYVWLDDVLKGSPIKKGRHGTAIPLGTIRSGCVRMEGYTYTGAEERAGMGMWCLRLAGGRHMCVAQPRVRCVCPEGKGVKT